MEQKLYIVKYAANEYDDLGYDRPIPIYYSLSKEKARNVFESLVKGEIKDLENLYEKYPKFKDNEDYGIAEDGENDFEIGFGKWFYRYEFDEAILDKVYD